MSSSNAAAKLRLLLAGKDIVIAPGASDALTVQLVKEAGFVAAFCTGGGISRSLGLPDMGYVTLTELASRIANMTEACDLPMIVDADSGFGNPLNVQRTVRLLERAGAAALHIEDEEVPGRSRDAKTNLMSAAFMEQRVKAMLQARTNPDFVLIARTDAMLAHGLDDAIDRANRYADAGADLVYVEFASTRKAIDEIARRVPALKLIGQNKGEIALLKPSELAQMGFRIMTHPADTQLAAIHAIRAVLKNLKETGTSLDFAAMATLEDRDAIVGTAQHKQILGQFLD